jgi:hypothetical protein
MMAPLIGSWVRGGSTVLVTLTCGSILQYRTSVGKSTGLLNAGPPTNGMVRENSYSSDPNVIVFVDMTFIYE